MDSVRGCADITIPVLPLHPGTKHQQKVLEQQQQQQQQQQQHPGSQQQQQQQRQLQLQKVPEPPVLQQKQPQLKDADIPDPAAIDVTAHGFAIPPEATPVTVQVRPQNAPTPVHFRATDIRASFVGTAPPEPQPVPAPTPKMLGVRPSSPNPLGPGSPDPFLHNSQAARQVATSAPSVGMGETQSAPADLRGSGGAVAAGLPHGPPSADSLTTPAPGIPLHQTLHDPPLPASVS